MAASSQIYQSKRERTEYWNGGFAFPDAKLTNHTTSLVHDSALMSLLEKIDNMDNNGSNADKTDVGINGVINSLEDEIGSKAQTDHNIRFIDENGSFGQMASMKQSQLTADGITEATSVTPADIGDFTYYDDVRAEFGFLPDLINMNDIHGIIMNDIHGDSIPDSMYSDAVYGYTETTEVFYGSLWEDDIWHFNEHPVIQNDVESPQQEVSGISGGVQFYEVWNHISTPFQRSSDKERGL